MIDIAADMAPDPDLPAIGHDATPRPVDWLATCLARIERTNDRLCAVIALDRAGAERAAIDSAARWRRGAPLSPIDGSTVLVKANYAVAGLPWHAGIAAYRDRIAYADATGVARLRAAGAVILGLTNMDEGALGATGTNPWLGQIGNPRDRDASAGGSSGGSAAAVAAGYCMAALGTDTIGSIAIPAAYCGVVGHRVSRDALPVEGIVPLSPTFDRAGWHTRSTNDAVKIGRVLGIGTRAPGGNRIGILARDALSLQDEISAALDTACSGARRIGWTVDPIVAPAQLADVAKRMFEVAEAESAVEHRAMLEARPDGFSASFRRLLAWGADGGARRRDANLAALQTVAASIRAALIGYDALLMPAVPHRGFAAGTRPPGDQALFAALPACLGWSATTVPQGVGGAAWLVTSPSPDCCLAIADEIAASLR